MPNPEETERDVIAGVIREEMARIQAEKDKVAGIETQQTRQPEPMVLTIGGQQYTFKTKEELENSLTTTFQNFQQVIATKPTGKEGSQVTGKEEEFSQDKYIDLMSKSALDAQNYALNHSIFGGKVPNASEVIRETITEAANTRAALTVYQFKDKHPDLKLDEAGPILEGIRKELGQPFTANGLEASYGVGIARGLFKTKAQTEKPAPAQTNQNSQGPDLGFAPPPQVNRANNGPNPEFLDQMESLSLEQLTALGNKLGAFNR